MSSKTIRAAYEVLLGCTMNPEISKHLDVKTVEAVAKALNAMLPSDTCTKDGGQCGLGGYCEPCHGVEPVVAAEPVAYADPKAFENFKAGVATHEWMWAFSDDGLAPLYLRAPASASVVLGYGAWNTGSNPGTRLIRHDGLVAISPEPTEFYCVPVYWAGTPASTESRS